MRCGRPTMNQLHADQRRTGGVIAQKQVRIPEGMVRTLDCLMSSLHY